MNPTVPYPVSPLLRPSRPGEPAWEVTTLFPLQGEWTEEEYLALGITEYWIVDPLEQRITVLALDGQAYRVHGIFAPGERATSVLLPGFEVDVEATFNAGQVTR